MIKKIIGLILILNFSYSSIEISGDARFRPRYDIKEYSNQDNTADFYYLYRARINLNADIGGGWFFKSKIGTNDIAGMTKMSSSDQGPGNFNSSRPNLSFMELYYGFKKENCGFWVGAFPLDYTPAFDLHFYSDKLVDIPWVLYNNGSTLGLSGYQSLKGHQLNWFLSVDDNNTNSTESVIDGVEDNQEDGYTLGFNSTFKMMNMSLTPNILMSFGEGDLPMTYGFNLSLPKLANLSSSISYYMSSDDNYDADHIRLQLTSPTAKGKTKFFYDLVNKDDDELSYIWLSYTHMCYKGDFGSVTISPTLRVQTGGYADGVFDEDYSRSKMEITTQIKFK